MLVHFVLASQGPAGMEPMPDNYILQRGECDVDLIEGRKYVMRVYLLSLGDGRAFVYKVCLDQWTR